jgi:hypothetical protein
MVRILKSIPIVVMKEVVNWSWQKTQKVKNSQNLTKKINANRRDEELTEIHKVTVENNLFF